MINLSFPLGIKGRKILIAPDKFKGSLSAEEVCAAIKTGILAKMPDAEVISLPLADGGEGFSEAIIGGKFNKKVQITVHDPINRWKSAEYFIVENDTAIIEMANASGLKLLTSSERNPLKTNTLGTGELIRNAIEKRAKEIIIGIGGSATNDAGMGMAAALGYRFLDKNDAILNPSGENMIKVCKILEPNFKAWANIEIKVACDVTNSLYGNNGAAYIFAKQKGANPQQIKDLDEGLRSFSRVVNKYFGKQFHFIEGAGAAGGLGYGLIAFLGAELKSGIELILEANNFEEKLNGVDLVITGEGKMDIQTLSGKVVAGVAKMANKKNIPVYGICGISELTESQAVELGLSKVITIKSPETSIDIAIKHAKELLIERVKEFF